MNIGLAPLIKLRDKPHDKSQYLHFMEDLLVRMNQIMRVLLEEKQHFESLKQSQLSRIREEYGRLLNQKEEMVKCSQKNLQKAQAENKRIELRLNEQLNDKEQSIQVLKGILKKRILNEVVRERENKTPTMGKITIASLVERKRTSGRAVSVLVEGKSGARRPHLMSHLVTARKEEFLEVIKRKSEEATTVSSQISEFYGGVQKISIPSSTDVCREDFI